jgi:ABC-type phosphate transport system substrate-binding protein
MKNRFISMVVVCIFLLTGSIAAANEKQIVAGAGPSTKIVQSFFAAFSKQPVAEGIEFTIPKKSAKHAGGIKCSDFNLFGRTGRPLSPAERNRDKREIFLAKVPIAFAIGNATGVDSISLENLKKIYTGKINNWKQLGGVDARILLVGREPTEALFMELKASHNYFFKTRFALILNKDNIVVDFMKSPKGKHSLAFGAKPNFSALKTAKIKGFTAGVRLGLVYDLKNENNAVVLAAAKYAKSNAWAATVKNKGMLPAN